MTYLINHNRARVRRMQIGMTAVGAVIVAVAVIWIIFPHLFPSIFTSIASPFWRTEFSISSGSLRSASSLLAENEELKRDIDSLKVEMATVQAVEDENTELKKLLGRASTTPLKLAAVLKRPPLTQYDELILDLGQDQGIQKGNIVYAYDRVPIGRIADVRGGVSIVKLFSSPGEKYDIQIGPNHESAVALGRGGGQFEAELPRDTDVAEGDYVTVPALKIQVLGSVISVTSDPAEPFAKILIAPPVNIYGLKWVLVDLKSS